MNRIAISIKNRLSLRRPQEESLNILAELTDKLMLQKDCDLSAELEKVRSAYPTCADFERSFPSICFALATGVGKTRLMGAFIAYLHLAKGIRNFFVLAPNLTVYNKLIEDFSNTTSPKYVFQGIGEFVHNNPVIVTGDNYNSIGDLFKEQEVRINVFNISKINAEMKGGKLPRIKRLSEYLGDSYFNYLSNLDDLVLLMDESHHYRADRGMEIINELKPALGLELTATPQVERSGGAIKFRNVVYEYSLARAVRDGFVKEPAIATRKDFDPSQYSIEDLDRIKLEDGIRIHEDTGVALDIFARDSKRPPVKPFVLVVAKDTEHAAGLRELIASNAFFNGYYADKVMEIHSNQTGDEKADLLFKLAGQVISKFRFYLNMDQIMNVVQYHKKEIGQYIYSQLMGHFYCEAPGFEKPVIKPFTRIEEHNLSKYTKDSIHHFTETITPASAIPGKVFCGFRKACHDLYKFDSKTEKDFAVILENDEAVLKWLRPAQRQFHIYWNHNSRQYHPDFVVETADVIYMVETKKEGALEDSEVREKTQAALQYCRYATEFTTQNGGKPWKYLLIPHNMVQANMSFDYLANASEQNIPPPS